MPVPSYTAGDTPEILDSRDLIAWANWNRDDAADMDDEDRETLEAIDKLEDEGVQEWHDGAVMIREDYFTAYAQQLAEDIGAIAADAGWPNSHIDWEAAADALKDDYTEVDYLGTTYFVRYG